MPTRLQRKYYLEKNICPNCKFRTLKQGYSSCETCYSATRKWMEANREQKKIYNKARYEALKAQKLCVVCTKDTDGNVYCRTCTDNKMRTRATTRPLHSRNRWSKR